MFNLHQTISQLVSSSGVSVQSKSHLKAIKTPPWASLALSSRTASKESGKISEFLISGVNQDSFPKMMSGFAESIIVWSSAFLFFIDWQFIIKILRGWFKAALTAFPLASLGSCTIGEEAADWGGGNDIWYRTLRIGQGGKRIKSVKLWYQTVMWKSLAFHIQAFPYNVFKLPEDLLRFFVVVFFKKEYLLAWFQLSLFNSNFCQLTCVRKDV